MGMCITKLLEWKVNYLMTIRLQWILTGCVHSNKKSFNIKHNLKTAVTNTVKL